MYVAFFANKWKFKLIAHYVMQAEDTEHRPLCFIKKERRRNTSVLNLLQSYSLPLERFSNDIFFRMPFLKHGKNVLNISHDIV